MKLSEQLRETIEELIATGELPPGSSLDEFSLAERYGVSRTPAREALIQLAAEGLIEIRPRRGAVVKSLGPTRLIEMFEVMGELEAMCGRLAARRMTEPERQALVQAHEACEAARTASDSDQYFYANERFHELIYAGSHNGFLQDEAQQLHRRLRPYRRLQLRVRNRMDTSLHEHQGVVDAIVAGHADEAAVALREHVVVQGERFGDLLASLAAMGEQDLGVTGAAVPKGVQSVGRSRPVVQGKATAAPTVTSESKSAINSSVTATARAREARSSKSAVEPVRTKERTRLKPTSPAASASAQKTTSTGTKARKPTSQRVRQTVPR